MPTRLKTLLPAPPHLPTLLALMLTFAAPLHAADSGSLRIATPRCDDDVAPLGVDDPHPRLSCTLQSEVRDDHQTAFQVLVASSLERLAAGSGDLWDSGRVASEESLHLRYGGRELHSSQAA